MAFRLCVKPDLPWQQVEVLLADPRARRDVLRALLDVLPVEGGADSREDPQ